MKFRPLKKFLQDDFKDAPQYFFDFLANLNLIVDSLNPLLQNGIDIDNNQTAERQSVSLSHNTPVSVRMRRMTAQPNIVRLGYAGGNPGTAYIAGYNTDGTVRVGVFFHGTAPTAPVSCILIFEP